ncbi:MAG: hypothetical protein K2X38_15035 [Gemmataceae bacterium]|nr:hypothetical protein [Gemmataceae bacterium]
MDDVILRFERTRLPVWICSFHGLGILATTAVGFLIVRSGDFVCAGLGGLWLLIPHLFGIFHAWSFPLCRPACKTLLAAAIPMALVTATIAIITWAEFGPFAMPRHFRFGWGGSALSLIAVLIAPLVQHALELSAFLRARRFANTAAIGGRRLDDDDPDIDLRSV